MTSKEAARRSWRDVLAIHPACELLPLAGEDELKALAVDMAEQGQKEPIRLTPEGQLIDGRNRLEALELLGVQTVTTRGRLAQGVASVVDEDDPYAVVMSRNLRRRQLTRAQKRKAAAELLKHRPEQSDRLTGKLAGVDHKTVARLRAELEASGEIPQLDSTVGADMRERRRPQKALNGELLTEAQKAGKKRAKGLAAALPTSIRDRVRELSDAGDVPATISRKLHEEIPAMRMTMTDVQALMIPPEIVAVVVSILDAIGTERALDRLEGLLVEQR